MLLEPEAYLYSRWVKTLAVKCEAIWFLTQLNVTIVARIHHSQSTNIEDDVLLLVIVVFHVSLPTFIYLLSVNFVYYYHRIN